jgi:2-keto-4-pentenoate hydratase/2-oxohepta-3-ene-1,7-dioic acid hydratase in catechol pathway
MKIAVINDNRLAIVQEGRVFDVSESVSWDCNNVQGSLVRLMKEFYQLKPTLESAVNQAQGYPLEEVKLRAPVPAPSKIWAAPVNYLNHQSEMNAQFNNAPFTIERLKLFLKAPSSIVGPGETILLPFKDRRHDHEAELAFVVGREAKNVSMEEAPNYIFGYFGCLDITLRGEEERTWRKSFDTFTPIGPWIVTADEVGDPHKLQMDLWVNDELRQSINTDQMIFNCYKCLEVASQSMTLYPGDIITTGTPAGVGPIEKGDQVRLRIERIGEFVMHVDVASE